MKTKNPETLVIQPPSTPEEIADWQKFWKLWDSIPKTEMLRIHNNWHHVIKRGKYADPSAIGVLTMLTAMIRNRRAESGQETVNTVLTKVLEEHSNVGQFQRCLRLLENMGLIKTHRSTNGTGLVDLNEDRLRKISPGVDMLSFAGWAESTQHSEAPCREFPVYWTRILTKRA